MIGEVLCNNLILVLNKTDLLPTEKAQATIEKMTKRLRMTLKSTKFAESAIIAVAAKPGGGGEMDGGSDDAPSIGVDALLGAIQEMCYVPQRNTEGPVVMAVDHCFGTIVVLTFIIFLRIQIDIYIFNSEK